MWPAVETRPPQQRPLEVWRDYVISLYPEALIRTYCVPPLHFNKVPYRREVVPGLGDPAFVLDPPPRSAPGPATSPAQASLSTSVPLPEHDESLEEQPEGTSDSVDAKASGDDVSPPASAPQSSGRETGVGPSGGKGNRRKGRKKGKGKKTLQPPLPQSLAFTTNSTPAAKQAKEKRVMENDAQDDFAQNHVVTNLQAWGEGRREPMFVLSQSGFGDYLNKPAYAAAALELPRPADLNTPQKPYSRGEADVLVIHRRRGILVGEIKSVGRWHAKQQEGSVPDEDVVKRVSKSAEQLIKARTVIRHLVSDVASELSIRTTIFLPYVSRQQLRKVLSEKDDLFQAVREVLEAADVEGAVDLCVCADQLSDPDTYWDVGDDVLSNLSTWWRHRMATDDPHLCAPGGDKLYLDIVARFLGPASTVSVYCVVPPLVEVRTAGQAVAELGQRLSRLVLTRQQMDILTRDPPVVCLTGPPGTGKTLLLVLQALRWLRQGHDVHLLSLDLTTLAVTRVIEHQLLQTLHLHPATTRPQGGDKTSALPAASAGKVVFHQYDFYNRAGEEARAVRDLLEAAGPAGELYAIMDEAVFSSSHKAGQRTQDLVRSLQGSGLKQLRLWCAGIYCDVSSDVVIEQVKLTTPLRFAPVVRREVTSGFKRLSNVEDYTDCDLPSPGEGPKVIHLRHDLDGSGGHQGRWPVDCEACGVNVANQLRLVGVGQKDSGLSWRDVFIVTRSAALCDDVRDGRGRVTSPCCGLVRGLRRLGVPTLVLSFNIESEEQREEIERRATDMALARTDQVTALRINCVHGLERRVVVWAVGRATGFDERDPDDYVEARDRLFVPSRCTTQLVHLSVPRLRRRWSWPPPRNLQTFQLQPPVTSV